MKIIDINGKEREIVSIKRIVNQVSDAVHKGQYINAEYVEVAIKGKHMTWKAWYPLTDFIDRNPDVVI